MIVNATVKVIQYLCRGLLMLFVVVFVVLFARSEPSRIIVGLATLKLSQRVRGETIFKDDSAWCSIVVLKAMEWRSSFTSEGRADCCRVA